MKKAKKVYKRRVKAKSPTLEDMVKAEVETGPNHENHQRLT